MKKRIYAYILACLLAFSLFTFEPALADDMIEDEPCIDVMLDEDVEAFAEQPPNVEATAAIVMDMKSGRVLYEKNAYSKKAMASTTKIMTAILAIEKGNLDDTVTVSKRAASIRGSVIHLKTNDKYPLRDLLYGLMLRSGNDAAIAIAEHIGGSVEDFAKMMTEKAMEIGAKNTSFKTPHGLDANGHYTTAYDLALITKYALANPTFSSIVKTSSIDAANRSMYNTNELLGAYPGTDGVKTGYTGQAGRCLVASVTRDNWRIISVVLGCATRAKRAKSSVSILNYSFSSYKPHILMDADEEVARLGVVKGIENDVVIKPAGEISFPLRFDEENDVEKVIELPAHLRAPVYEGIAVGNVKFMIKGKVIAQTTLKTEKYIRKKGFWDYLGLVFTKWNMIAKR